MKEYHVVLKGLDGFQKEQTMQFEMNCPPPSLHIRNYEPLYFMPLSLLSNEPPGDIVKVKDRCFRQRQEVYALGKNIIQYTEER